MPFHGECCALNNFSDDSAVALGKVMLLGGGGSDLILLLAMVIANVLQRPFS